MRLTRNDRAGLLLFLAPGAILFVMFFLIPAFYVAVISLFKWDGMTSPVFNQISNYVVIWKDSVFRRSLMNNIIWALVACLVQVPLAVLMALILSRRPRGWQIFRTIYFFPQVISGVAMAMLWQAMYNSEYGLINGFLKAAGRADLARNWLGNLQTALPAVLIFWVFYIGYYMVIIMSDLSGISQDFYEAAEIDGAGKIQQAWFISLPMARGSIMTCLTLASILSLRQFEQVFLLTNGGPANRTSTMVLYLYKQIQNWRYGSSSAASVMLILVGVVVILSIRGAFRLRDTMGDRGLRR